MNAAISTSNPPNFPKTLADLDSSRLRNAFLLQCEDGKDVGLQDSSHIEDTLANGLLYQCCIPCLVRLQRRSTSVHDEHNRGKGSIDWQIDVEVEPSVKRRVYGGASSNGSRQHISHTVCRFHNASERLEDRSVPPGTISRVNRSCTYQQVFEFVESSVEDRQKLNTQFLNRE
jgi:hypothetical protein